MKVSLNKNLPPSIANGQSTAFGSGVSKSHLSGIVTRSKSHSINPTKTILIGCFDFRKRRLINACKKMGINYKVLKKSTHIKEYSNTSAFIHYIGHRKLLGKKYSALNLISYLMGKNVKLLNEKKPILICRNQQHTLDILKTNRIRVPTYVSPNQLDEKNIKHSMEIIKNKLSIGHELPTCVFKDCVSSLGYGIKIVTGIENIEEHLKAKIKEKDIPFIIQKYYPDADKTYRAIVIEGEFITSMSLTAPRGKRLSNLHQGGKPENIRIEKEAQEMAVKAAEVIGIKFCGVDLIKVDHQWMVLEVNYYPGWGIAKVTNTDLPGKLIEALSQP
jgi:glutathione synthase/RimK-type ligase-like ATP-grasp enzyme